MNHKPQTNQTNKNEIQQKTNIQAQYKNIQHSQNRNIVEKETKLIPLKIYKDINKIVILHCVELSELSHKINVR